jgi:hypothetical protein
MIVGLGSGSFGFVPSSSTSVNRGSALALFSNAGTTTASQTWDISSGQNNTAGNVNLAFQAVLNANGSIMTFLAGPGTYAGRAAFQFGARPSGIVIDFSATSGTQVCMALGGIAAGSGGSVQFNPASGSASFVGLNIAPIINQTSTASGSYTALQIAVTETSLKGTANFLINALAGTAGATSVFSVTNSGVMQLGAASGAPTSAGTAGTAGQILYFGGLLYFCSVTGAAGSATWNKLSMVSV